MTIHPSACALSSLIVLRTIPMYLPQVTAADLGLLIGAWGNDDGGNESGKAYLVLGGTLSGTLDLVDCFYHIELPCQQVLSRTRGESVSLHMAIVMYTQKNERYQVLLSLNNWVD